MEILPIIVLLGLLTAITLIDHCCWVLVAVAIRQLGGPFLLRGSVFLLLAIVTMIYYASVNVGWTWMGYVAGIVTGGTIIFMFAVFEKKRGEVLRVVDGVRNWDG